ncbi:aquaporin family protein [Aliifodinibius sp. S!AR15-10]|uniref:MIP/aquaporin family protein n=1 Tax=Aliifodinibius sp. S!AR15-10 TaxID=2950437 RepID=UPI00285E3972|nr:MIP/aquaporin family protein [Aliifodinibius sp. S!AR15-10]MDR8392002.1 aquaporin family protein [Aliifodinibius sp. S!AR15-10]
MLDFSPFSKYLAEILGTFILCLLGNGVVANVILSKTKGEGGSWLLINTAWGFAVAIAVYSVGWISGAHINPAVTVGLASIGEFSWALVPGYIMAQVFGGFLAGIFVYVTYKKHYDSTQDAATKLGTFSTIPAIRSLGWNTVTEAVGTAVLLIGILGITSGATGHPGQIEGDFVTGGVTGGMQPFIIGVLVWAIGMSLGGPTGYAINPARDLGPRLAHAMLPLKDKGSNDWTYGLTAPIIGPLIGGIVGSYIWMIFASYLTTIMIP